MAQIKIKNLRLKAIIGTNPEEREVPQEVVLNVTFEYDTRNAALSDRLEDAVNYHTLSKRIGELVERSRFFLLEKLANEVLTLILAEPRIEKASVEIAKPAALKRADSVSLTASRSR